MSVVCYLDQTTHESIDALHAHLKTLRISRERYWHAHMPRRDLLTGELIPFRDYEQYTTQSFVTKVNLRRWLKEQPREVGLQWATEWLAQRRAAKGLVYAPSQIELRTLPCPSMPYYEAVADGGYYGLTARLGYQPRYTRAPLVYRTLPATASVIQDTREQTPVKLPIPTVIDTLKVGDYALTPPYDEHIRIERKSLGDFCGTLSAGYDRFARELDRAATGGLYVVMMVEASLTDAQRFDYLPQTKWVKATPAFVFHRLRELLVKYPLAFQAVFVDGRKAMPDKMVKVLTLGAQVRTTDLQFAVEEGLL